MSKDIIFHDQKQPTNPTCILPDKSERSYVSLNLQHSVLIKHKKRYIQGIIIAQTHKNARWYYRVQTMKFTKWCGPTDFKITLEK